MEEQNEVTSVDILKVSTDNEGRYSVTIEKGMSVEEVAFAMAVVIKVFGRDGVIKQEEMLELVKKYIDDSQYQEVVS